MMLHDTNKKIFMETFYKPINRYIYKPPLTGFILPRALTPTQTHTCAVQRLCGAADPPDWFSLETEK